MLLKKRQQAQNEVTCVKSHITKPRLNASLNYCCMPLPHEWKLKPVHLELPGQQQCGNQPDRTLPSPKER